MSKDFNLCNQLFVMQENKNKLSRFFSALFHGVSFYLLLVVLVAGVLFCFKVYSQEKEISMQTRGTENIAKDSKMVVRFSSKMLKSTVQEGISVEPSLKLGLKWNSEKEMELVPMENPVPETQYMVKISGAKTKWRVAQGDFEFKFHSPNFPKLKKVYPQQGESDIDYREKIMIEFDEPVRNDFFVKVEINPLTTKFSTSFNENRTQLVLSPLKDLEKSTEYSVGVRIESKNFPEISKELYAGAFKTKVPPIIVYSFNSKGQPLKSEPRQEDISPQIKEGRYIDIDLSSQAMFLFENGKELGAFKISSGLRGMDTPTGTFKVMGKAKRPWSATYKLYMPWFIQFTNQGHGIHELPEWPGGIKEGTNHLGIPVSHGCVRLGIGPAKVVYDFAETGTPIVIHN